jgi:hypothetical protein
VGLVVVLVVLGLAGRYLLLPALSGNTSAPSAAESHLSDLQTQEALAPQPTPAPTQAPTSVPVVVVRPTLAPTAVPTAAQATVTPAVTPQPTIPPALTAEVSQAYLRYFQVSADALRALNPDGLDAVATGDELQFLKDEIEKDRAAGRALDTEVEHHFSVVQLQSDQADVADAYRDSSIFVDVKTGEPLPGQLRPATPEDAPVVKEVYHLRLGTGADGTSTWKVERVDRYA